MKTLLFNFVIFITISCNAQIYPLRTYTSKPENSYLKDTNNEFQAYVGTWKTIWNSKITYLYITKVTNKYDSTLKYYRDYLIIKYKVTDFSGNVLHDTTNYSDDNSVITGMRIRPNEKYSLQYVDETMCGRSGTILINFTDSTKTQIQWKYMQNEQWIDTDCWYYNYAPNQRPQPLPLESIFTKE